MASRTDELRMLVAKNLARADQLNSLDHPQRLRHVLDAWLQKHSDVDVLDLIQGLGTLHDALCDCFHAERIIGDIAPERRFPIMLAINAGLPAAMMCVTERMGELLDEYQEANPDAV